jgi:hypothetical protein
MAARRIVYAVIESSFGTPKSTPVLGTDCFYNRLHSPDSFDWEETEVVEPIPYGGGVNIEADGANDLTTVKGRFNFLLYPGVWSKILLNWAITPINGARTAPWVTTDASGVMPAGDLASLSFYDAFLKDDGTTYDRKRIAGCKCETWELSGNQTAQGRIITLSGEFTGIRVVGNPHDGSNDPDATEFPLPAEANYPTGPFLFSHFATGTGTATVGTNRAASMASWKVTGRNTFDPLFFTGRFLTRNRYVGRTVSADISLLHKASPDDRTSYRNQAALDCEFKLDNGSATVKVDFNAKNVLRPWTVQLGNGEYLQRLALANRFDPSAAGDVSVTVTP